MARYSNVQSNFSGGLVTDHLVGRIDIDRMANSGRKFENFLPTVQGPAEYRPGFQNIAEETNLLYETSVSESITFAGSISYRVVFGANELKVFDTDGTLIDTVVTPYTSGDLKDLRFSSETDVLYITHPLHRPKILTATDGLSFDADFLQDVNEDQLVTSDGKHLTINAGVVQGAGDWSLTDIDFKVEPLLEPNTSTNKLKLVKDQEIVKIVSTNTDLQVIIDATTPTDYYVEYELEGNKVLGKVLDSNSTTNYSEVADPAVSAGVYTIYVDAVDFITKITDPDAKLFLLDNAETTGGSIQETQLKQEGVPDGDVILRSDVDVFNNSNVGSFIRLDSEINRSDKVLLGADAKFDLTRWVKITDYIGIEAHPVEFYRGAKYVSKDDNSPLNHDYTVYESGGVYKAYGDSQFDVKNYDNNKTGHVEPNNGNRVFSWTGGDFTGNANNTFTVGSNPIVGNLSTAISFEVVKCDSSLTIQEYDVNLNSDGILVKTDSTNTTVTEIANDVVLEATENLFDASRDVNRHIRAEFASGNTYMKILSVTTEKTARAKLITVVPRDKVTGDFEGDGVALSFSLGAWFVNNYPRTVAKYEQRRVYGGTLQNPNFVFMSRLNEEEDFSPTQPNKQVLDTDGFVYTLSNVNAGISWIKAASDLIIGTSRGIFKLVVNQFQASVSPKTIRFSLVDEIGCSVDGVLAGTSIFFPDESNTELLEYKFDTTAGVEVTEDVSKLVYPTFVNDTIKKVVYQNNPQPRLWVLTESGVLYCLTYNRQENYYAWSKHTHGGSRNSTNTTIEDITVLRKGYDSNLDQLWVTVKNTADYAIAYEVMFSESDSGDEITYFTDSGVKLTIDIATTKVGNRVEIDLTNTPYASGGQLSVVYDGVSIGQFVVSSGNTLNITEPRSTGTVEVVIGQNYTGTLQMMYPTWDAQNKPAFGTETQRVISQKVFVINSSTFSQGVDGSTQSVDLPNFVRGTTSASGVYTGFDIERPLRNSQFGVDKIPELRQDQPYRTIFGSLVTKVDLN
jgi:hypothetical protein